MPEGFRSVEIDGDLPDDWTALDLRRAAAEHFGLPLERIPEPRIWEAGKRADTKAKT
jgi:hypothetical protein